MGSCRKPTRDTTIGSNINVSSTQWPIINNCYHQSPPIFFLLILNSVHKYGLSRRAAPFLSFLIMSWNWFINHRWFCYSTFALMPFLFFYYNLQELKSYIQEEKHCLVFYSLCNFILNTGATVFLICSLSCYWETDKVFSNYIKIGTLL